MPLPGNHTLNTEHLTAYTPSCGASPAAAYIRIPFRCRVLKATGVLGGAITTTDGSVTVTANGNTLATFTVPQAGSAAGLLFSAVPPSPTYLNEDDVVVLTPSGASGAAVPMYFSLGEDGLMSFFPKQPASRLGVTQTIAYDSSVGAANAFGTETYQLRLVANSACCYRIGDGTQTATIADSYLPANVVEYVIVSPGQQIAAIKAATNGLVTATAGTLWIAEMS